MKFLVVFVAFAMFVSAQALTDAQKTLLKAHYEHCTEETGVDKELVKKTRTGDFSFDDAKTKSFMFCMLKRSGVMTDDGVFHRDIAVSKVEDDIKEDVGRAIDICVKEPGSTNDEKAWNYVKCYHKERPNHAVI
ncbi:general odorant-binding protein 56d-like [Arctopsyche grandis]|uniref:general odorant-binding protein 56d-like n=1 Tax=Arctopsyche grandis TaxID=121162 RepID=UPI00406D9612